MQLSQRQRVGQTVFYTCLRPYQVDGVRGHLALCLNERLQRDARESRRDEILHAEKLLAQGKSIKPGLERFFDLRGRLLATELAAAEEFDGYSCVFCTRPLPQDKMLSLYFNKDVVEKAFRSLKGSLSYAPFAIGWRSAFTPMSFSATLPICSYRSCSIGCVRRTLLLKAPCWN